MAGGLSIGEGPRGGNAFPSRIVLKKLADKKMAQTVFHEGEKYVSEAFVLYGLNHAQAAPRYAIYMKKRYGIAVERNRAKRLIRAALYQLRERMPGYQVILIPRRKMKTLGFWQVVSELQHFFCQTGASKQG